MTEHDATTLLKRQGLGAGQGDPPCLSSHANSISVRVSVTGSCQLRCRYCLPAEGSSSNPSPHPLKATGIRRILAWLQRRFGIAKIRFTGGEPLLRRDLEEIVAVAHGLGIPELALTTNGQLLAERAASLRRAGLSRINISIDSLRPERFEPISRGGSLDRTLRGIAAAREAGLDPIKLNMVVMRGVNDDEVEAMLRFGLREGLQVRFLELMPIGVAAADFPELYFSSKQIQERVRHVGIWKPEERERAASSRDWKVRDSSGRETVCGFISPFSHPFCEGCRRLRITAEGRFVGCLVRGHGVEPWTALDAAEAGHPEALDALVTRVFGQKRVLGERFEAEDRCMAQVGG